MTHIAWIQNVLRKHKARYVALLWTVLLFGLSVRACLEALVVYLVAIFLNEVDFGLQIVGVGVEALRLLEEAALLSVLNERLIGAGEHNARLVLLLLLQSTTRFFFCF